MISFSEIEDLLPGYLSDDLSVNDRAIVDGWLKESPENEEVFLGVKNAWEALPLLRQMEQFNSFDALKKVNERISPPKSKNWWVPIYRAAAILLLPLLVYSGFIASKFQTKLGEKEHVMMQMVTSRQGMVTRFSLSDGTKVWLNSGSELQFPTRFSDDKREVYLKGEAFFEVTKNEKQPFRVNANELKIEVLGTSFNVVNFDNDSQSEVVLVTGKVALSYENGQIKKIYGTMQPCERVIYEKESQNIRAERVEVEKYIAWRDGNLIFRDDSMDNVVKRLSRWFNVEITISDPEIKNYIYKATFRNENLVQVLNLLKLSAPIDYQITTRKTLPNGEFSKQNIILMKRKS